MPTIVNGILIVAIDKYVLLLNGVQLCSVVCDASDIEVSEAMVDKYACHLRPCGLQLLCHTHCRLLCGNENYVVVPGMLVLCDGPFVLFVSSRLARVIGMQFSAVLGRDVTHEPGSINSGAGGGPTACVRLCTPLMVAGDVVADILRTVCSASGDLFAQWYDERGEVGDMDEQRGHFFVSL